MFSNPKSLFLGCAMLSITLSSSAHAIVSTTTDSRLSGAGVDFLDGVAKLILTRSDGNYLCSGSLLSGGEYVLTAAHCVSGSAGTASTSSISLSWDTGTVSTTADTYYLAPGWNGDLSAGNDLALIKLSSPITSITGYELYSSSAQNSTVLIAGYGLTGTGDSGATGSSGSLYYGYNQYDANWRFYQSSGVSSSVYLYDFDDGTRSTSLFGSYGTSFEALIAPGDSGGASLLFSNDIWYLVGIHSFGGCSGVSCTPDSSFGDYAGDVSVFGQMAWLQSYLTTPVSVIPAVPEPRAYALFLAGLVLIGLALRRRQTALKPGRAAMA